MKTSVYHGGDLKAVKQTNPNVTRPWIDLSTGLNPAPYPWQTKVVPSLIEKATAVLPQQEQAEECISSWTTYLKAANPKEWVLTAGSQAVINILPQLFPEHQAVIPEPCYGEHERVWQRRNHEPLMISRNQLTEFELQENRVVILTSPNNPDGYIWPQEVLFSLATALEEKNGYLVIDEAFADITPDISIASEHLPDNLILLRSFGKFFGLAGMRLGLARFPEKLHTRVQAILGPWAVNGLGTVIACHALLDTAWINKTRIALREKTDTLQTLLEHTGSKLIGGTDLFSLVEHENAQVFVSKLNASGIHVRSFEKHPKWLRFGLPADTIAFDRLKEACND